MANVSYCSYSWKLGRPIIPMVCGWLATARAYDLELSVWSSQTTKPASLLCLLTSSPSFPGDGRVYQSKRKRQWLFLPLLSLGWVLFRHLVYTYVNSWWNICFPKQFFAFCKRLKKNHCEINTVIRKQVWKEDLKFISKTLKIISVINTKSRKTVFHFFMKCRLKLLFHFKII